MPDALARSLRKASKLDPVASSLCSTLNWNTLSRAKPYPSRTGENLNRISYTSFSTALPTSTKAIPLFRLSTGQCNASGLSEKNHEETNVKNYMVDLTHFLRFFFMTHDVLHTHHHEGVPLYRGGGVPYKNEDWSATHKDEQCTRPPFPHPMHIASRMSHHLVVKPQSATAATNNILQIV